MDKLDVTIGIVGSGGDGVVAAGDILTRACATEGLRCMMMKSFGPQIRGGESSCRLRVSENHVYSHGSGIDVLVCFNWSDYQKFSGELEVNDNVVILVDERDETLEDDVPVSGGKNRKIIRIPFADLAAGAKNPRGKNMVMLGVITEMFGLPAESLKNTIKKKFARKGEETVKINLASIKVGEDFAKTNFKNSGMKLNYQKGEPRMILTGNHAVAFGALAAGCKFYSSYPITPASEIMEWLSVEMPKVGGIVVQAEDEISAICMVTGASYGGVKAMTATSGPGLSLKSEAIGLGTMAEIPYVVVDVQRGGPSTGLPTKAEQGDLYMAIHGAHGDAPHAVIAASDVEDCFRATIEAFNVSETYQMPVILLSDQYLAHRAETVRELNFEDVKIQNRLSPKKLEGGGYRRFVDAPDGISPMTWPGIKCGEYLCSGIEHNEDGSPSASHDVHEKMCAKRRKKLKRLEEDYGFIRRYGERKPRVGVIGWGSNKGVIKEAVELFASKGEPVGALVPQLIYPLQSKLFREFISDAEAVVIVENSYSKQFWRYLRSRLDLPKVFHLNSSGGRLFTVKDVIGVVEKALNNG